MSGATLDYQSERGGERFGLLAPRLNYRQAIAALMPAFYMVYAILIWPLIYAKSYTANEFTVGMAAAPPPSILSTLVFPVLCAVSIALFIGERERLAPIRSLPLVMLVLFWGLVGLSATWAFLPPDTFKAFIVLTLIFLGIGLSTLLVDSIERVLKPLFWVLALTMVVNLADVLLTPPGPIGHEGIYIHKNDLGGVAAIGLIFALYGLSVNERFYRSVSVIALLAWSLILIKSESKTSLGLTLVAPMLGVGVTFARHYLRISFPVILAIVIPLVLLVVSDGVPWLTQADISQAIGGDSTFTGRVAVWEFILQNVRERPLTGFGFHSFWHGDVGDASPTVHAAFGFLQKTPTAHNGYLELLLQLGWIGLGVFTVIFFLVADWISRITDRNPVIGCAVATMFIFVALHNLLESTWFADNNINAILINLFIMATITARPAKSPKLLVKLS